MTVLKRLRSGPIRSTFSLGRSGRSPRHIHRHDRAADVVRGVGGQEQRGVRDALRLGRSDRKRHEGLHPLKAVSIHVGEAVGSDDVGVDGPRADGVDPNSIRPVSPGEAARQAEIAAAEAAAAEKNAAVERTKMSLMEAKAARDARYAARKNRK